MIQLKFLGAEHIAQTFEWVRQPELQRAFLMRGAVTRATNTAYFNALLADARQRAYAITLDGKHIGNCGLKHIDHDKAEAEMWLYLGESTLRGNGYGQQALELMLREANDSLGVRMVVAHVAHHNLRAQALYRRVGFVTQSAVGAEWDGRDVLRMCWSAP
jgi:RimJ/RimL family protein N-acetyltransferase